jgi:tRNA(fMet)-specific endonuclease VapC
MEYLLDTNIIIDHLKGKEKIDISWLKKGACISIITYAELLNGAYKSNRTTHNIKLIEHIIKGLTIKIINLNQNLIHTYSSIRTKLEKKGKRLDEFDLLIAASAIEQKLILITSNHKHFERIPKLKLEKI